MNESVISWTPANWITVVLMVAIAFAVLGAGTRIIQQKRGSGSYNGSHQRRINQAPHQLGDGYVDGADCRYRFALRSQVGKLLTKGKR